MNESRINELSSIISHALTELEVYGSVRIAHLTNDTARVTVYLDGEYFGIYDTCRNTFID